MKMVNLFYEFWTKKFLSKKKKKKIMVPQLGC